MSMSLDECVADADDVVGEVFDWYVTSGNVENPYRRVGPHDVQGGIMTHISTTTAASVPNERARGNHQG